MAMPQPAEVGLFEHITEVKEFILFVLGILVGLVVWAWTRMEKSVDKCADAIETHAANNEVLFDKVFDQMRESNEDLHKLIGEHKSCQEQVRKMAEKCIKPGGCQ